MQILETLLILNILMVSKRTNRKEGSPYENMSTSEKELTRLALFSESTGE